MVIIKNIALVYFECNVQNTLVVFLFKILYIIFWTFILNILCKGGYNEIAWFLVLLPILLLFVLLGLFLLNNGAKLVKK